MISRALHPTDVGLIKKLHAKHFANELDFPDFFDKFLCAFLISTDDNIPVVIGGVRTLTESVIMTNKDIDIRTRREALYQTLNFSVYIAQEAGYDQLHAFIQDEKWLSHLKRTGFKSCKGSAIYLPVS